MATLNYSLTASAWTLVSTSGRPSVWLVGADARQFYVYVGTAAPLIGETNITLVGGGSLPYDVGPLATGVSVWLRSVSGTVAVSVIDTGAGGGSANSAAIDSTNSTTANLANGAIFTGTAVDMLPYGSATISVIASHASAANGLSIQQSPDGTNWDIVDTYTVAAATSKTIQVPRQERYMRVVYTNGGTLTTYLRLQTVLNSQMIRASSVKPADATSIENDFDQVLSAGYVYNGTTLDVMRSALNGMNTTGTGILAAGIVAQVDETSITTVTENQFGHVRMTSQGIMYVAASPTTGASAAAATAATTVAAGSLVLKASAGNLYGVSICTGGSAGYLMVFNATSAPADGTVTPAKVYVIAANASAEYRFNPPLRLSTGCTLVFSTTGPFTKTISATAFLSGECL